MTDKQHAARIRRLAKGAAVSTYRYGSHPICPACGWGEHDDWWCVLKETDLSPRGVIECGCGRSFEIIRHASDSVTSILLPAPKEGT